MNATSWRGKKKNCPPEANLRVRGTTPPVQEGKLAGKATNDKSDEGVGGEWKKVLFSPELQRCRSSVVTEDKTGFRSAIT